MIADAPCDHPASRAAPTMDEASDVATIEFHEIDRQQENGG